MIVFTAYDRAALRPRLLHIGFGAFARAHVFTYLDDLARDYGSDWGAIVARLHSGQSELDALDAQNGLYTVVTLDGDTPKAQQIGVVLGSLHPLRDGPEAIVNRLADAELSMVTLTITEKGYLPGGSALSTLVLGLAARRAAGHDGLTILSCDNLPNNGAKCQAAVLQTAREVDGALAEWIDTQCRFPCSMVDRIVPALDENGRALIETLTGSADPNGAVAEPFRQWVIEDNFAGPRPALDHVGVQIVTDVQSSEDMKLRMLNGSHSFLAYLGGLTGHETIADCMANPVLRKSVERLMKSEACKTLTVHDTNMDDYADELLERFSNTGLRHETKQIAQDGSQKVQQRLINVAVDLANSNRSSPMTALAIGGWMAYYRGVDEAGNELPLQDPLSDEIIAARALTESEFADVMVNLPSIDMPEVAKREAMATYHQIRTKGVMKVIEEYSQV